MISNLRETTKAIQRQLGATVDGVFGPETAAWVWRALTDVQGDAADEEPAETLDARTLAMIATLDPKAREAFVDFAHLAKATAATLGCDYVMTGGNRSWEVQDKLYAHGRTMPGPRVTNAAGGQSNHNFGIAGDFAPFQGKLYLDAEDAEGGTRERRALGAKVHKACAMHAAACGLEWGGSWKSIIDQPHYEIATGLSMMQKRELYKAKGSVL